MKQKQWIAFLGMVAVALIFAACDGDSGNNSTEPQGDSSSSAEISSSGEQVNLSSVVKSSSSSAVVSSSSGILPSSSSIQYGSFIYGGQTYKTVTIGTQTWMAENLNYADSVAMPNLKGNSWCYDNSADNCTKYGRLYAWTAAMNIASSYYSASATAVVSTPHQGACPAGWHIPTSAEWTTLENAVGDDVAGMALMSTSGWYVNHGTDAYGFSALPGGDTFAGLNFDNVYHYGGWWTATEYSSSKAYFRYMYYFYTNVLVDDYNKVYGRSLRCLKD